MYVNYEIAFEGPERLKKTIIQALLLYHGSPVNEFLSNMVFFSPNTVLIFYPTLFFFRKAEICQEYWIRKEIFFIQNCYKKFDYSKCCMIQLFNCFNFIFQKMQNCSISTYNSPFHSLHYYRIAQGVGFGDKKVPFLGFSTKILFLQNTLL